MDWQELGMEALAIILPVVIVAAAHYLRRLLIAKIGAEQFEQAQAWAWRAVKAAEQLAWNNPEKFIYAVDLLASAARRRGINLDSNEIQALIESSVREMKQWDKQDGAQ